MNAQETEHTTKMLFFKGEDLKNIFESLLKFKALLLCDLSNLAKAFAMEQFHNSLHSPVLLGGKSLRSLLFTSNAQ